MKKRLQFIISLILVFMISLSALVMPASSFTNDVVTSTEDMLLVNLDTHTTVFSRKPDNMWYCGYLTELMTFLIAEEELSDPTAVSVTIEQDFIDALPYSDGCLNKFVGEKLTAQDLMGIMLMTTGSDAAYALADLVTDGDRDTFVKMMNDKAVALGMTKTNYLEPGYSDNKSHHTTCRDLMRLYLEVDKSEFYNRVMEDKSYTPAGLKEKKYTVNSQASILNDDSPYYFRYCNDAKYSYTNETDAGIVPGILRDGLQRAIVQLQPVVSQNRGIFAVGRQFVGQLLAFFRDGVGLGTDRRLQQLGQLPPGARRRLRRTFRSRRGISRRGSRRALGASC